MSYATISDMTKLQDHRVLASLVWDKDTGTPDIEDEDVVALLGDLLVKASALADGYLRVFHTTPLPAPHDPQLTKHVAEIAIDLAYQRRGGEAVNPRDKHVVAAFEWLEFVRAGAIKLEIEGETHQQRTIRSTTEDTDATFTRDGLEVLG